MEIYSRVYRRRGARSLMRVLGAFELDSREAALIFGVSARTIDAWLVEGVPARRSADVERIASLAGALKRRFKSERLPQIVRASLDGLRGHSILTTIQTNGIVPVFEMLERAFAYPAG